jgi:hypothetical protein
MTWGGMPLAPLRGAQATDLANALLLRADLHIAFDQRRFVFVPKGEGSEAQNEMSVVMHLLGDSPDYETLYHNRALQGRVAVRPEFLFARLAWSIFPLLEPFLTTGLPRRLLVGLTTDTGPEAQMITPDKCKEFISKAKSRNSSPTKRSRGEGSSVGGSQAEGEGEVRRKRRRLNLDSDPSHGNKHPITPLPFDEASMEAEQFNALKREWLLTERARSDPGAMWEGEEKWAERVLRGEVSMGREEAGRLAKYAGFDTTGEEGYG